MASGAFLGPVSAADPCGPNMRWDPQFQELTHAFDGALAQGSAALDAEVVASGAPTFREIADMAEKMCSKTKDLRVLAIYVEAQWRDCGLAEFAEALELLVSAVETWPDPDFGLHPRADEEDGDLGERVAAFGKLVNRIPALTGAMGWGAHLEISERLEVVAKLRGVFDAWDERLGSALGTGLPSKREAWRALQTLVGDDEQLAIDDAGAADDGDAPRIRAGEANAWDLIEHAAELMARQNHHSPALPVLRLLATWRGLDLVKIVDVMRPSGITMEQLLASIKQQTESPL